MWSKVPRCFRYFSFSFFIGILPLKSSYYFKNSGQQFIKVYNVRRLIEIFLLRNAFAFRIVNKKQKYNNKQQKIWAKSHVYACALDVSCIYLLWLLWLSPFMTSHTNQIEMNELQSYSSVQCTPYTTYCIYA